MYSWVVDFLNYFISISERDIGIERREVAGDGIVKKFFFCKYLYIVFIIFFL